MMNFITLKKAIQICDEKNFYDIAILYLKSLGFCDLEIVDGPRDGGVDVISSRTDIRIQLSVRKNWENKINEEAQKTITSGKTHFMYITNRNIDPSQEAEFLTIKYKYKDQVTTNIHPLSKIATTLNQPEFAKKTYSLLGIPISDKIEATHKEIATSTLLLFSKESRDLKQEIIEVNIKSILFKFDELSIEDLENKIRTQLKYDFINIENYCNKMVSKLISAQKIVKTCEGMLTLSTSEKESMNLALENFASMQEIDVKDISRKLNVSKEEASVLLNTALDVLTRGYDLSKEGPHIEKLRDLLSKPKYRSRKLSVFKALSSTNIANLKQYGIYIDQLMSSNTFDIYRALGQQTELVMLLDSNVAMPMLFGLEFEDYSYRYSLAAKSLKEICYAHGIRLEIPRCYLNEMAAHGARACAREEVYNQLPIEIQDRLKYSRNAYIAHYTHIKNNSLYKHDKLSLNDFLGHFGIKSDANIIAIENKLQSLFERHNITITSVPNPNRNIKNEIKKLKPYDDNQIINHDASILTLLQDNSTIGYILATWDKVMQQSVQDLVRVLADTPSRIINLLGMVKSESFSSESNIDILDILLYADEGKITRLAEKIDEIKNLEHVYKLSRLIDETRTAGGSSFDLTDDDVLTILNDISDS